MPAFRLAGAFALLLAFAADPALASTANLAPATSLNLGIAGAGDPSPDATNDMSGFNDGGLTSIQMINSAAWAYASVFDYNQATLLDAQAVSYSTGNWRPSNYNSFPAVYYIRTGTGGSTKYFKLIATGDSTGSGIPLQWNYLGAGAPAAPVSNFTFDSYDLITNFADTSSGGTPTSWSWTFGDGGTSTLQNPRYRYTSAGSRSACLTASNSGGGGGNTCKTVTVSLVPSTTVAQNASIDFDNDSKGDLLVSASGGCPVANKLVQQNGARWALIYKDYRNINLADAQGAVYTTAAGGFCVDVDYLDGFLVLSSFGAVYRAWTAANDAGSVRIEYDLLIASERIFANGFQ
jgi:PKD repeat protein